MIVVIFGGGGVRLAEECKSTPMLGDIYMKTEHRDYDISESRAWIKSLV
jgi:hypothetical protein